MDWSTIGTVAGAVGTLVAIPAVYYTLFADRKRDRLAAKTKPAYLQAEFQEDQRGNRLIVANHGEGMAKQIRIELDGKPWDQHEIYRPGQPIETLVGGMQVNRRMNSTHLGTRLNTVSVHWLNEDGTPGEWTSDVRL